MSSSSLLRIAGVAGVIAAICMIGFSFTMDQTTMKPNSLLFPVLLWLLGTGVSLATGRVKAALTAA